MRTLLLLELGSRKDQANFRSDGPVKTSESSLAGTILAGRYKVLETIDVDSYKAHDLALDQTVIVRKALLASPDDSDIWRQKVRQLALVRNAEFFERYRPSLREVERLCHHGVTPGSVDRRSVERAIAL